MLEKPQSLTTNLPASNQENICQQVTRKTQDVHFLIFLLLFKNSSVSSLCWSAKNADMNIEEVPNQGTVTADT